MVLNGLIDFFIHPDRFKSDDELRKARLLVRGSLLTSLFSNSYLWLSFYFSFQMGIYMMLMNVVGFLLLPFLVKTKIPIVGIGNIYVLIGAIAVTTLAYYSGGTESALYPWIVSIPVLSLLIVNRTSAVFWGAISFTTMVFIGFLAIKEYPFPEAYDKSLRSEWFTAIVPGLLLIILFIAMVFEFTQQKALQRVANQNAELLQQQAVISEQKEELKSLIEEKDYIIRILSHDLRGPLGNIKGLIRMMDMETDAERKDECKELILQTSLNAENLVNRVLEMDRSEQESDKVDFKKIDLLPLLDELINKMQGLASKKSIKINLLCYTDKTTVVADKTYVNLIFENLLSNAIKFSQPQKNVTVTLNSKNDYIQISVADQGPGIHPEEEDHLFKKFSKLSTRPTAGESSTGLGLSLVKRYVETNNGTVRYDREASTKGATFVVELPLSN